MFLFVVNARRTTKSSFLNGVLKAALIAAFFKSDFSFEQLACILPLATLFAGDDDTFSKNIIIPCFYFVFSDGVFYFTMIAAGAQSMTSVEQANGAIIFVRIIQLCALVVVMAWWAMAKPSRNMIHCITTVPTGGTPILQS